MTKVGVDALVVSPVVPEVAEGSPGPGAGAAARQGVSTVEGVIVRIIVEEVPLRQTPCPFKVFLLNKIFKT